MIQTPVRGQRALVTGASSGLGADFARGLARRGCHLILVARRTELLAKLEAEITTKYGVEVESIPLDLTAPDAPRTLYDQIRASGKVVDVLINNAGFGLYGEFVDIPWERTHSMLELDVVVLTHLTRLFVADMAARRFGFVLLVSSIGAYSPSPTYASYSAAKSYVLSFGEALHYELRGSNVGCTVVSPGIVATEFLAVSGQQASRYQRMMMMTSHDVAEVGIQGMLRRKSSIIPGRLNALTAASSRFVPRRIAAALAYRLMTFQ
ncbi:MAG: SDR family oxidoreductase [Chloroflexota bacterium]